MTQQMIIDLLPFTEYSIQVAAVESDGTEGQLSPPLILSTLEDSKICSYLSLIMYICDRT